MIARVVDIGGIVDNHCLYFIFLIKTFNQNVIVVTTASDINIIIITSVIQVHSHIRPVNGYKEMTQNINQTKYKKCNRKHDTYICIACLLAFD